MPSLGPLSRIPLWAWALILLGIPMLIRATLYALALPLPYGTIIGPGDPDPWLRLSLVRDWLSGVSWYDHEVLRSNAPYAGISTPWTRPLDVVIALFVKAQLGLAPLHIELQRAALFLPCVWMMLLLGGLCRAVMHLQAARITPILIVALIGAMPVIWNYFGTGNADHHALLCALWVWALAPHLAPLTPRRTMVISGMLLALMLWISPEALVLIGLLYMFYGIAWLAGHDSAKRLPVLASAVAFGTAIALIIERPMQQWAVPIYDSLSVVHVLVTSLTAIMAWVLLLASSKLQSLHRRLIAGKLATFLLGIVIWQIVPKFFLGPMAEVDPFIFSHFLPRITEAQPLFTERPFYVVAMLIQPFMAAWLCIFLLRKRETLYAPYQAWLLLYLVAMTSLLYFTQQRWYYYFYPVVVIALAPYLAALFTPHDPAVSSRWPARALNHLSEASQLKKRGPIFALALILPLVLLITLEDRSTAVSRRADACQKEARILIHGGKLNGLADGKALNFLAPTDLGGEMLFFTPHRIVASNYHREGKGLKYVWDAESIESASELRTHLSARQIDAILFCPDATTPKTSYLLRLQQGKLSPPAWLSVVPYTTSIAADSRPLLMLVK